MRLHFWAFRETGVFEQSPTFAEYYVKFIGHFVSVYERTAPPFARESARWSADEGNVRAYHEAGNRMVPSITGLSLRQAMKALPEHEAEDDRWPWLAV